MKNTPQFEVQLPAVVLTNGAAKSAPAEVSNTGGRFLTNRSGVENIFTREKLSDEQRNMQQTATDFALNEIAPNSPALRALDANAASDLLKRTADLGLLAIDVQDGYDLVCLNSISSATIAESFAAGNSPEFDSILATQTENLLAPLILYSNSEQKSSFLNRLLSGDTSAAYQIANDRQNLKAHLSADNNAYIVSGSARFISSAEINGFIMPYVNIDGQETVLFTTLNEHGVKLIESNSRRSMDGLFSNQVEFNEVRIPIKQVLHSLGGGKAVLDSTRNLGEVKRSATILGHCKQNINQALQHALESRRFSRAIAHYNLTKGKFADMVLHTYALDSMVYRTAGYLNQSIIRTPGNENTIHEEVLQASEQFSIECAIIKIFGIEALNATIEARRNVHNSTLPLDQKNEAQQLQDDKLEFLFNNTGRTDRLQVTEYFLEKTLIDELPLRERIRQMQSEQPEASPSSSPLAAEMEALEIAKELTIYLFNQALVKLGKDLLNQQQVVELLSNLFIDIYAMDSCLCRARQQQSSIHHKIVKAFCVERILDVGHRVELALYNLFEGSRLEKALGTLYTSKEKMNLKYNVFKLKQEIAEHLYSNNTYCY